MPATSQWTAYAASLGDYTTRGGGAAKFWVTNWTGNTLTIDITTNGGYKMWDANTNTGWTVNKALSATAGTALFYIVFDSSSATNMNLVFQSYAGMPVFV